MASAAFESQAADLPDSEENHNGVTSSASTASTPPNHDHTDGPGPRVVDALVDLDHKDQQHRFPPSAHQWRTRRRAYSLTDADRERMAEVRAAQWQQAYMEENKHLALLPAFNRLSTIAMMVEAKEGTGRHRKRPKWSSKTEYMLSCISFAVGLGNLWRFPYLCYENGGGAFLVPYFVALLLLGMPMFLLELAMGQKLQMGHVRVWRSVHSKLSGLGVASAILSGICALYYNIIITWAIYFFIHSFSPVLPWTEGGVDAADSAKKFWLEEALRQAPDMNGGGGWGISPLMIACLTIAWLMVYFCIFRGISSTGKVVYFTALFPYVVLAILFVRGVTLPGAVEGIKYYLKPDLTRLANFRVWSIAGSQIFFSIGISWGSLINFASFNSQKNNIFMDTLIVCIVNCGTSLFAGFVVFSVLGYMAFKTGLPIDEVARAGSGLAFVVYPAGLGTMNHAFVFSILFFLMLICLGLGSEFCMVEVVMTSIVEASLFQGIKKWKVAAAICAVMWAVGLLLISPVGKYWVDLLDDFTGAFALFVVALVEVLAVVHIYKLGRFSEDVAEMTGMRISKAMRLVYRYVTPIGIAILLLSSVMVFAVERRSNFQHSRQPSVGKGCVGTCGADANPPRGVCETRNMFCRCKRGWGGADCTTKIDTRVYSCPEDCNGQGVCDETTQQCTCFAEFEGESCRGDKYAKGFPPWALFVGFMVAIVSVLPIPLVAFWKHLRKRVKQKIDENPEATQTAMYPSSSRPPATPSNSTEDNASSDSDDDDDGPPPSALTSLLSCMPGKRKTGRQSARGVEMSQQNGRGGGREDRKHLPSSQPQFDDDDSDDERF